MTAPSKEASALTGKESRGLWPAGTSALRTVVKMRTANGRALTAARPTHPPRVRILASARVRARPSPPFRRRKASSGLGSSCNDDVVHPAQASDAARPVVCVGLKSPECGGRSRLGAARG